MKQLEKYKLPMIIGGALLAIALLFFIIGQVKVNGAINLEEEIEVALNDVRIEEKSRNDKLLSMADVIKQYDSYEANTLISIVEGRTQETEEYNATTIINAVAEAYPELKSQDNYSSIMNEIALSNNAVANKRTAYNELVADYNKYVRKFPNKQLIGLFGYDAIKHEKITFIGYEDSPALFE